MVPCLGSWGRWSCWVPCFTTFSCHLVIHQVDDPYWSTPHLSGAQCPPCCPPSPPWTSLFPVERFTGEEMGRDRPAGGHCGKGTLPAAAAFLPYGVDVRQRYALRNAVGPRGSLCGSGSGLPAWQLSLARCGLAHVWGLGAQAEISKDLGPVTQSTVPKRRTGPDAGGTGGGGGDGWPCGGRRSGSADGMAG